MRVLSSFEEFDLPEIFRSRGHAYFYSYLAFKYPHPSNPSRDIPLHRLHPPFLFDLAFYSVYQSNHGSSLSMRFDVHVCGSGIGYPPWNAFPTVTEVHICKKGFLFDLAFYSVYQSNHGSSLSMRFDVHVCGSGVGYPPWNAFLAHLHIKENLSVKPAHII
ncbi:hypothetical protein L2E82_49191 [Cichorium intybus]|uniref:Uncharacterized protein n=1 Tax=Cichorium intybus TaxID=13427 RepID=A0ACB8Z0T8_CICIN|nr:hypothetical protein L2E82_49191 [Cichorium intybus]